MPGDIATLYSTQFTSSLQLLSQQKLSRFEATVSHGTYAGEKAQVVDHLGETQAVERTTRNADTPLIEVPYDTRFVQGSTFDWATLVDTDDKLKILADPVSSLPMACRAALNRVKDDKLIAAFDGLAKAGKDGNALVAFPSTQEVLAATGSGNGMNFQKLLGAFEIFLKNDVDLDGESLWCALSPKQYLELFPADAGLLTSGDFVTMKPVETGRLGRVLNMQFIVSTRLVKVGNERKCFAYCESGMHLGTWKGQEGRVEQRADKNYAWQVWGSETTGATRVEEKKVVRILCDET
ncbi:MAG: hypothetical protein KDG89_06775 [Geminicoccaceae bacterium]|nr:hypothetical protein [Geminicoccaceae bacterium]